MIFGRPATRSINLALQGGGAHGAFTWGVLDALLEDGRIAFDGISGTSAGAMNAVVMAHGLLHGGRDGARAALQTFWNAVAASAPAELTMTSSDGKRVSLAPMVRLLLQWTHYFSPTQINPFDLNPLRDIVSAQIDFEQLRAASPVKLFIAATHANSGKLRLFRETEVSVDVVLASACLPTMHRAVEIDGEPYWDGGYCANPAVFPLFYDCDSSDIVLVLLSPLKHAATPHTAQDIHTRVLEIAFNATFLREMRMFAHLRERIQRSRWLLGALERRVARTNFHVIEAEDVIAELSAETKLAANLGFFAMLAELGRTRARAWLQAHHAQLGRRSTVDLSALFY
ncbi:MAG TPA: patatin-like phospholipase family protein [Burkholderiaceae bacterium]